MRSQTDNEFIRLFLHTGFEILKGSFPLNLNLFTAPPYAGQSGDEIEDTIDVV